MFWDCLSMQPTQIFFFFQMSVGSDSDMSENEKDLYQQSVLENEIDTCEEILKDVDNILNEFPNVPEFLISIPIPLTNIFFHLKHQFSRISIPVPSTKVLLMYLITIPLALHLIICLDANQLMYQKTVRRKIVQGHKSKNQKGMPKKPCFSTV